MKKIFITLALILSANVFAATPAYTIESVNNYVLSQVIFDGTISFLENDFNSYVAGLVDKEIKANPKYKAEEHKKELLTKGLKYIYAQLGYELTLDIRDKDLNNVEFAFHTDKDLTSLDKLYLDQVSIKVADTLYAEKEIKGFINYYKDSNLKNKK